MIITHCEIFRNDFFRNRQIVNREKNCENPLNLRHLRSKNSEYQCFLRQQEPCCLCEL